MKKLLSGIGTDPCFPDGGFELVEEGHPAIVASVADKYHAAQIVKRCNLHDELVEALGKATRLVLDVAEQQAMPDDSWKPAWDECIAVIRKARGKA